MLTTQPATSTTVSRVLAFVFGPGSSEPVRAIRRLVRQHPNLALEVRLWDGRTLTFGSRPMATLTFDDEVTFRDCFESADPAAFAEAYVDGRLRLGGDIRVAIELVLLLGLDQHARASASDPESAAAASRHFSNEDSRDARRHYDLSDEFFKLILDERMVYSCAYFSSPGEPLDVAQARKLDVVCRKLQLRPSEVLLDVGCGWGALVIWAAVHYGVRAIGTTLSEHQCREARRRVAAAGLDDRVTIELRHYADLPAASADKIASIGAYEHVGLAKLSDYCRTMYRALRPGGLFLNHGITIPPRHGARVGGAFMLDHVFPGAEFAELPVVAGAMEAAGFETVDVHSLRPHYALTLRAWYERFLARAPEISMIVDERTQRIWNLYLAGCAKAFELGLVNVHQVLGLKPEASHSNPLPLIREV